jgi:hypothetical protein
MVIIRVKPEEIFKKLPDLYLIIFKTKVKVKLSLYLTN